jgi:hypothetical protein
MLMSLWMGLHFLCHVMAHWRIGLTDWSIRYRLDNLRDVLVVLRKKMAGRRHSQGHCWSYIPCDTGEARHSDS